MSVDAKRARPWFRAGTVLAFILAVATPALGPAPLASDPKPAPSPAPQVDPPPPQDASGAAAGHDAPAAPEKTEKTNGRGVFGTIMGTVFDIRKKPLAGWMVQLSSRRDDGLLRVTGTNEKGQYVFKDLPAGTYDIEIQVENEAARRKGRIEVRPPFRNIVDFQIGPQPPDRSTPLAGLAEKKKVEGAGAEVARDAAGEGVKPVPFRGTFVDAQKRPIAEVSVTVVGLDGEGAFQVFSGDDGSFAIPAVPPGRYRVLVFSPGYVPIDLKSVEVTPASGLSLSLRLVDHPLNTKERPEDRLPREEPLKAPPPAPASRPS
jgi:protocatechuate 3,4-dioxygenase beta subunit